MVYYESNYLCHYGLKGMKWGQRRWQNADGTFNAAGKARYFGANSDHRPDSVKEAKQKYKAARKEYNKAFNNAYNHNHPYSFSKKRREASNARWEEAGKKAEELRKAKSEYKQVKNSASRSNKEKLQKAAKIGATIAAAGLVAYGGYKLYSSNKNNKSIKNAIMEEAMREKRAKGQQALVKMYDQMASSAVKNGAISYSFTNNKIGYNVEMRR
jgi:hypothetical protein